MIFFMNCRITKIESPDAARDGRKQHEGMQMGPAPGNGPADPAGTYAGGRRGPAYMVGPGRNLHLLGPSRIWELIKDDIEE